jgi:hypothetical protein
MIGKRSEPGVIAALYLLDVGDEHIGVVEVITVGLLPANSGNGDLNIHARSRFSRP